MRKRKTYIEWHLFCGNTFLLRDVWGKCPSCQEVIKLHSYNHSFQSWWAEKHLNIYKRSNRYIRFYFLSAKIRTLRRSWAHTNWKGGKKIIQSSFVQFCWLFDQIKKERWIKISCRQTWPCNCERKSSLYSSHIHYNSVKYSFSYFTGSEAEVRYAIAPGSRKC